MDCRSSHWAAGAIVPLPLINGGLRVMVRFHPGCSLAASLVVIGSASLASAAPPDNSIHDLVLRNGTVYDGSGQKPFAGDIAIDSDRITYVGPHRELRGRTEIDIKGQAVAPGFINMLAHPEE